MAWTAIIRARLHLKISSRLIRRLLKRAGLQSLRNISLEQARSSLKTEYGIYSNLKRCAATLRNSFIEQLATAQADDRGLNVEKHLQQLRDWEQQRQLFRRICSILQSDQRMHGLTYIIDPEGNECNTKDAMEQACLKENKQRFNQASDTPLLTEPLYGLLGPLGQGPAHHDIINGTFTHPEVDPVILQTLNALQSCDASSLDPPQITVSDYRDIWRHSKERTSSCPKYNLHFGHYIAIAHDELLSTLHTQLVDITLMSGYSPLRWRVGLNVMIPKKIGDARVTNLRTLLLYDAEFNAVLKWLG